MHRICECQPTSAHVAWQCAPLAAALQLPQVDERRAVHWQDSEPSTRFKFGSSPSRWQRGARAYHIYQRRITPELQVEVPWQPAARPAGRGGSRPGSEPPPAPFKLAGAGASTAAAPRRARAWAADSPAGDSEGRSPAGRSRDSGSGPEPGSDSAGSAGGPRPAAGAGSLRATEAACRRSAAAPQ
jgi:hypothetical protein